MNTHPVTLIAARAPSTEDGTIILFGDEIDEDDWSLLRECEAAVAAYLPTGLRAEWNEDGDLVAVRE
jgi:hypothetical protein